MHPIERLRYVARVGDAPDRFLVAESAHGLAAFSHDQNALLVAVRQLIARHPRSTGLLCLAAHMLHDVDPSSAAYEFAEKLESDRSIDHAESIAVAEAGGTDVIDSIASGSDMVLCPSGTRAWVEHARDAGRSVVVVTPTGSRLPSMLWRGFLDRNSFPVDVAQGNRNSGPELLSVGCFDDLIDSNGVTPLAGWVPDCPDVAELSRR